MTLRERIADWISGGALTEALADVGRQYARAQEYQDHFYQAQYRLDRIAAQETPNANATVKRMARIARGEE